MSYQIIPLSATPNQRLRVALSIDGVPKHLELFICFNEAAGYWLMDIVDPETGTMLLKGIPLVTGEYPAANILGQYGYLGLGSAYVVNAGGATTQKSKVSLLATEAGGIIATEGLEALVVESASATFDALLDWPDETTLGSEDFALVWGDTP